jgi:hypothetical protein
MVPQTIEQLREIAAASSQQVERMWREAIAVMGEKL